jgi:hypothetical protein
MKRWDLLALFAIGLLGLTLFLGWDVGVGVLFAFLLGLGTLWFLSRMGHGKEVIILFGVALVFHGVVVLFLHYTGFQPFTGGDYDTYHRSAQQVAERLSEGTLNFEGIKLSHAYPVIVGVLYALLVPSMVVGQFLNAWLGALAIVLLYFLAREAGTSKGWALAVGLIGMVLPSFVFFGNLLLKERVVTVFILAVLLLSLRMLKRFSWPQAFLLVLLATILIHFRVYMGLVFIGVFLVAWFLFAAGPPNRRALVGFALFLLLGLPPFLNGEGYYGATFIVRFLDPTVVRYYKEQVYNPLVDNSAAVPQEMREIQSQLSGGTTDENPVPVVARDRATVTYLSTGFESPQAFLWNYTRSFALTALGPFPWHFKSLAHSAALLETIPWLILALLIGKGVFEQFRRNRRNPAFFLVLFSLALFASLAFYFSNFGILMRIRIPAIFALLPFIAFAFPLRIPYTKRT